MDDVHILGHIQAMTAQMTVDFMAAVVRQISSNRTLAGPAFLGGFAQHFKASGIVFQLRQCFRCFRTPTMHQGIVVAIINHHKIVLVLPNDPQGILIAFIRRVANDVVHLPFQENLGNTVSLSGDDDRLQSGSQSCVKNGLHSQNRLYISLNTMILRIQAGIHGSKTNRRNRRHDRPDGQGHAAVTDHFPEQLGIFLVQPQCNGIRIVQQGTL